MVRVPSCGWEMRNEHGIGIDTESLGIGGVQRVLRVNECNLAAQFLSLSHDMEGQGGFARGFGPVVSTPTA